MIISLFLAQLFPRIRFFFLCPLSTTFSILMSVPAVNSQYKEKKKATGPPEIKENNQELESAIRTVHFMFENEISMRKIKPLMTHINTCVDIYTEAVVENKNDASGQVEYEIKSTRAPRTETSTNGPRYSNPVSGAALGDCISQATKKKTYGMMLESPVLWYSMDESTDSSDDEALEIIMGVSPRSQSGTQMSQMDFVCLRGCLQGASG